MKQPLQNPKPRLRLALCALFACLSGLAMAQGGEAGLRDHSPLPPTQEAPRIRGDDPRAIDAQGVQPAYGDETRGETAVPAWLFPLLGGLLLAGLLAGFWQRSLKRMVRARTAELARANERLSAERDFSNALLDTAAALIVVLNPDGRIVRFNKAAERITGYRFAEVEGNTVWELFIPAAEQAAVRKACDAATRGDVTRHFENFWRMKDSSLRLFDWSNAAILNQDNAVSFVVAIGADITERKTMEQELHLWGRVFEHADWGVALCMVGTDCFDYVNPAFARQRGYSVKEIQGISIASLFPPEQRAAVPEFLHQVEQHGHLIMEGEHLRKDGSRFPVQIEASAIRDSDGAVIYRVAYVQDITERKAREAWLRRFEEMTATTTDLMSFVDADYTYCQVNAAYAPAFGVPKEAIIGRKVWELLGEQTFNETAKPHLDRCLQGEQVRYQAWFEWADGRHYLDVANYPYRERKDGPVTAAVISVRDITAQHQAREAAERGTEELRRHNDFLRFLSRAGESFSSSLDLDKVLDRVLQEILKVLHITSDSYWIYDQEAQELTCHYVIGPSAESILGHRLKLGQGITGCAADKQQVMRVSDTREDPRHYKGVDRDTGIEIRSIIALPLIYREALQGVLACVDATPNRFDEQDQQLLEAMASSAAVAIHNARVFTEMVELRQQAESANRAKSAFLANMSHELRTPLNAVLGYTQILLKDPHTPPGQMHELQAIANSGHYLLLLINDILDLAKIEAGRFELFPASIDPHALFEQIYEQFLFKAGQKGLMLTLEGLENLPKEITLDEKRLRQIVMNLLGNAIKFTEQGEIILRIDYQDPMLDITVQDTGIGIGATSLKDLFSPYSQAGDANYRRQGSGLGLAISNSLVKYMGGRIEVESELGEGSRFAFRIPAPITEGAMRAAAPTQRQEVIGYQRRDLVAAPLRLLVVDNEENNRNVLQGLLAPLGFTIDLAQSGADALRLAEEQPPDLVLMDIVMPEMDGLEATRSLLAKHPQMRVVTASAMAFAEDRNKALQAGCIDHLTKPVQWDALLAVLEKHLPLSWKTSEALSALADDLPNKTPGLDLCALPPERLQELEALLIRGNGRALNRFADAIEPQHKSLAAGLRERLERYDYDAILKALTAASP